MEKRVLATFIVDEQGEDSISSDEQGEDSLSLDGPAEFAIDDRVLLVDLVKDNDMDEAPFGPSSSDSD